MASVLKYTNKKLNNIFGANKVNNTSNLYASKAMTINSFIEFYLLRYHSQTYEVCMPNQAYIESS